MADAVTARRRRGGNGQVRIEDVARRAGVAPITVSRALRTPDKVSQEARQRIAQAIAAVGYVPNLVAGSLASNRTNLVAALVPNIGNPLFAMTLRGLSDVLKRGGLQLMIASTNHSREEEEALVRTFLGQRPCGLVLHETIHSPEARQLLLAADIPIVETGDLIDDPMDVVVSFSNFEAIRETTIHLGQRGCRRIALVTSALSARSNERRRGYEAGLAALGLPVATDLVVEAVSGVVGGIRAIGALMDRTPAVDAVLFTGNATAVGGVLECQRRGWAIPGRIAVATFDDTELTQNMNPPLTAVRIPRYQVGETAGQALLDRIQGRAQDLRHVDLGFELVVRGSS